MKKTANLYWGKIKKIRKECAQLKNELITLATQYNIPYQEVENDLNRELAGIPLYISEGAQ